MILGESRLAPTGEGIEDASANVDAAVAGTADEAAAVYATSAAVYAAGVLAPPSNLSITGAGILSALSWF